MAGTSVRGRPVVVLALILCGWVALRWVSLYPQDDGPAVAAALSDGDVLRVKAGFPRQRVRGPVAVVPARLFTNVPTTQPPHLSAPAESPDRPPVMLAFAAPEVRPPDVLPPASPPGLAGGGGMVGWMAATAWLPLPLPPAGVDQRGTAPVAQRMARWSGDGWVLLRGGVPPGGAPGPRYGASQIGSVLRYRLGDSGRRGVALYLRASTALDSSGGHPGTTDGDIAAGLQLPLPTPRTLPLTLFGEARAQRGVTGVQLRASLGVIAGLAPQPLGAGLSLDGYGQAGWVSGPAATASADGQLHLDRALATVGRGSLRVGIAAWGGRQRGAGRVDLGPVASWTMAPAGSGPVARLEMDWRLRIAGDDQDGSTR